MKTINYNKPQKFVEELHKISVTDWPYAWNLYRKEFKADALRDPEFYNTVKRSAGNEWTNLVFQPLEPFYQELYRCRTAQSLSSEQQSRIAIETSRVLWNDRNPDRNYTLLQLMVDLTVSSFSRSRELAVVAVAVMCEIIKRLQDQNAGNHPDTEFIRNYGKEACRVMETALAEDIRLLEEGRVWSDVESKWLRGEPEEAEFIVRCKKRLREALKTDFKASNDAKPVSSAPGESKAAKEQPQTPQNEQLEEPAPEPEEGEDRITLFLRNRLIPGLVGAVITLILVLAVGAALGMFNGNQEALQTAQKDLTAVQQQLEEANSENKKLQSQLKDAQAKIAELEEAEEEAPESDLQTGEEGQSETVQPAPEGTVTTEQTGGVELGNQPKSLVVLETKAVYKEKSADSTKMGYAEAGTKVDVLEDQDDNGWMLIQFTKDDIQVKGYILNEDAAE